MTIKREVERKWRLLADYDDHETLSSMADKISMMQTFYTDKQRRLRMEIVDWRNHLLKHNNLNGENGAFIMIPEWTLTCKSDFLYDGPLMVRDEHIVHIDPAAAFVMLSRQIVMPVPVIKIRYTILYGDLEWEVDRYINPSRGHNTVEVEFNDEVQAEVFDSNISGMAPPIIDREFGDVGNVNGFSNWQMAKNINNPNDLADDASEQFDDMLLTYGKVEPA